MQASKQPRVRWRWLYGPAEANLKRVEEAGARTMSLHEE